MKFYQLNSVKQQVIKNSGIRGKTLNDFKANLKSNYHINVLEKLKIDKVYMLTSELDFNIYLNQEQIDKINLMATINTGLPLVFYDIPFIESNQYKIFPFEKVTDISKISNEYKTLDSIKEIYDADENTHRKNLNKERVEKFGKIKNSVLNKKIISVDFEFNLNTVTDKYELDFISEIGFTIRENNNITNKHFIVTENMKQNGNANEFLFGDSVHINKSQIKDILNSHLEKAELLVVHSYHAELRFLEDNNLKFDHLNILDVQLLYKNYYDNDNDNLKKLAKILLGLNLEYSFLHNAGNDAHFTYKAFEKIISNIKLEKKPTFKI